MIQELMRDMEFSSVPKLALFLILALLVGNGCDFADTQSYDPSEYTNVYMPQAQGGPAERSVPIVDSIQTLVYNAAFAGATTPKEDISVRFQVETALVDTFNQQNATSYEVLPGESYELTQTEATIPAGERSTGQLGLKLATEGYLEAQGTIYLLPIRMEVLNENVRVNEEKQVTYFVIQGSYLDIDKSDWELVDFDSQQPGRSDLAAVNVIDGDPTSIWHTPYCCDRPPPPHWVTIDMGESNSVHGLEVIARKDDWYINNPKEVTVEFADEYNGDDTNWRDAEDFTLPFDANGSTTEAEIYLENTVDARYFKFTVTQSVGGPDRNLTNMGELTAF